MSVAAPNPDISSDESLFSDEENMLGQELQTLLLIILYAKVLNRVMKHHQ